MILSRLGNTVTNKDRKKIRRKLYEIEKKRKPFRQEKRKDLWWSCSISKDLWWKKKYKYHDRDDLDDHVIRDIEI